MIIIIIIHERSDSLIQNYTKVYILYTEGSGKK